MSDPEKIKRQKDIPSKNVTPEDAAKDLDELKQEELEEAAGGAPKPWADTWTPEK